MLFKTYKPRKKYKVRILLNWNAKGLVCNWSAAKSTWVSVKWISRATSSHSIQLHPTQPSFTQKDPKFYPTSVEMFVGPSFHTHNVGISEACQNFSRIHNGQDCRVRSVCFSNSHCIMIIIFGTLLSPHIHMLHILKIDQNYLATFDCKGMSSRC